MSIRWLSLVLVLLAGGNVIIYLIYEHRLQRLADLRYAIIDSEDVYDKYNEERLKHLSKRHPDLLSSSTELAAAIRKLRHDNTLDPIDEIHDYFSSVSSDMEYRSLTDAFVRYERAATRIFEEFAPTERKMKQNVLDTMRMQLDQLKARAYNAKPGARGGGKVFCRTCPIITNFEVYWIMREKGVEWSAGKEMVESYIAVYERETSPSAEKAGVVNLRKLGIAIDNSTKQLRNISQDGVLTDAYVNSFYKDLLMKKDRVDYYLVELLRRYENQD